MLSRDACRRLLGAVGGSLPDPELDQLIGELYTIARFSIALYQTPAKWGTPLGESAVLSQLDADTREAIEERAAVLEFDAAMPRDRATRAALQLEIDSRTRREHEA